MGWTQVLSLDKSSRRSELRLSLGVEGVLYKILNCLAFLPEPGGLKIEILMVYGLIGMIEK